MEIIRKYAQTIVDKTIKILGYNINIMDSQGIIVGSGDKKRINTFHQGAAEVIRIGRPLEITFDNARNLEGVKPGVNLPIYLNNKIVGVVGITGEPDEVRAFGELLKVSVETMLQEAFLSEQLRMQQNAKDLYLYDLILGNFEDEDLFEARGEALGFDMKLPRIAVVIAVEELNAGNKIASELLLQKKRDYILSCIKGAFADSQNMIGYVGSNSIVVFCVIGKIEIFEIKKQIFGYIERLENLFQKDRIRFKVGIGKFYKGLKGLKKSYSEALQVLALRERMSCQSNVTFAADVSLEIFLNSISGEILDNFIANILPHSKILDILRKPRFFEVLKVFLENDLNISVTAKILKVSRNTVVNRLERIKEITGLDVRNFNDAIKLKLLLLICELKIK
ncbi:CdaR family transcriptional regulator [Carboxydothermus pertinax]|uniref:CdaR family transcriptional regulator n=1 Tax=Carboxydothermus pertinax TaxID=870242 RepID=A0A1L8CTN9_9THEO|nr:sugar diacid recognition domain-containing protein [Carboxydothermus pertinax]GAV22267.1 CdaR family transcriptional regulator [Carboxydothermus pertinax]